jgi:hypothetical protein
VAEAAARTMQDLGGNAGASLKERSSLVQHGSREGRPQATLVVHCAPLRPPLTSTLQRGFVDVVKHLSLRQDLYANH